jgi:hypothetical protein
MAAGAQERSPLISRSGANGIPLAVFRRIFFALAIVALLALCSLVCAGWHAQPTALVRSSEIAMTKLGERKSKIHERGRESLLSGKMQ